MGKLGSKCDLYNMIKELGDGDIAKGFERFYGASLYIQTEIDFRDKRFSWDRTLNKCKETIKYNEIIDIAPYFNHLVQQTQISIEEHREISNRDFITLTSKPWYDAEAKYFMTDAKKKSYKQYFERQLEKWRAGERIV